MRKLLILAMILLCAVGLPAQQRARMLSGVNYQTGALPYTFVTLDATRLTTFTGAVSQTANLPNPSTVGFGVGYLFSVYVQGVGDLTITATAATIGGSASINLTTGQGVDIYSDGVNYSIQGGKGTGGGGGGGGAIGPVGTVQASDGAGHFQITGENDDGSNLTADRNTTFLGPNPTIDLTRYGVRSVTSAISTTGSMNVGVSTHALTVADGSQLIDGDGIVVRGAGANCTLVAPDPPVVTASNAANMLNTGLTVPSTSGATAYQYQVVGLSSNGCYTVASTVTAIANGQATLGATTVNISSWTRANNVVTITTAAPHTLVTGSLVWLTATLIDGFYNVTGSADNTHFTVSEGTDTRNGAASSGGATGVVNYWIGNHITWTHKAGTLKYLIYGRTGGSMALIGVSLPDPATFGISLLNTDPLYNNFDDWGSTITKTPGVPDYYPTTPPVAAKNADLTTTIASGGGTNNIVTTDAATNTVGSVIVKQDNTKPFLNAIVATYGSSSQGGVLRFPVTTGPTDIYLFNSMFVLGAFPSMVAIEQDGPVGFLDTVITQAVQWHGNNPLSLGTQFGFDKYPNINSGSAHPIFYTLAQNVHFSNVSINGFSNSQNLWVQDLGGIPASSWYNVNFSNAGTDWVGQGLIIRNNIAGSGDFDFKNVSFSGGPLITDKDPTPLFQATQGLEPFNFDRIFLNRRGMYIGANTNGIGGTVNNIYCQGCIMPKITLNNNTGGVSIAGLIVNSSIEDTLPAAVPLLAYFGQLSGVIQFSNSNGTPLGQTFNGNGSVALDLRGVGQAAHTMGQNVFVSNIPSRATAISGTFSNTSTAYPLFQSDMAVAVGAPFSIYVNSLKQPAPTCSNTGVGIVPAASYTFRVAPVFANGGEGPASDASSACTSNGSQQITINWTLATGAIGYDLYVNGFSFQCAAPWVNGGATLSYIWVSVVPCGQAISTNPGAGPSGISSGSMFSPQVIIPAINGGGFGTLTAPALSSNPAWSMPDNAGVGIFTPNPTTPTGVPQVPVYIPGTTPVNSSGAYALQGITPNAQSGATYTIVATDRSKVVTFNNAAETYVTIPQAGTAGFTSNIAYRLFNRGVGLVVLTPTTSTINGLSQLTITSNMFCTIMSDNTNYLANCETYSPFNIDNYGAVGDLTTFSASLTSGTTALTCVGCTFTTKDIGKTVLIQGANGGLLAYTDTIAAFVNATSVTLTTGTSTTTVTNSSSVYGTDSATAFAAALTAAGNVPSPGSGLVVCPANEGYLIRTALTIPGNVSVQLDCHLTASNGVAAVLQTTTNTVAPFWEHQRIFGIGVLSLGNSAFRGIWMHQGRHNDISGINVRAMGQTNSIGIQVGDPTAGQVGGYETMISHVSFGTHSVSGGSNSRCVSIDNTTNGRFTDSQTDSLVGNGCATGIFDGQGGDRNSNGHFWGPSLATAYNGTGDFWIGMEADTPSSVGFEVTANEQISSSRCFFGSTGTDNTATCVHSATTEPPMVISGLRIQGVDGSHRWALDSNLLRVNLTVSTISGVQSTNVVTQNISGNAIIPGAVGGGTASVFGGTGAAFSVSPEYVSAVLGTNGGPTTGITDLQTPIASAKTIGNFYVHLQTAVAGAASVTYTLVKNGTATAVTCTVAAAGTACNDTTHTFTTAAGDLLNMQITFTGTPGNITQFWSFTEQ